MLSRRQVLSAALGLSAAGLTGTSFTRAQTPSSGAAADPTLSDYLSISPASIANLSQAMPLMASNQQLQAETLGVALPFDLNNDDQMHEWIVSMFNVTAPSFLLQNVFREDFLSNTGFDVTQLASAADIGEPPSMVTFIRGTFSPLAIQAVQLLNGYKQLEIDGRLVFSLFEDAEIDLTHPVSAMALARMNNSTILDDGTLVYASTLELIEQVLTPGPTLLEQPGVSQALNTLDTPLMNSAVLGPGNFLPGIPAVLFQPASQDEIAEAMEALRSQEPAPVVLAGMVGDTPGGPIEFKTRDASTMASQPDSLTKFALVYATSNDAQTAATQIEQRLATGASIVNEIPWAEMFSDWSVAINPEQNSVLLTIKWEGRAGRAVNLVFNRDLGFITG